VGLDYKAFEVRLLQAIHRRFGLPPILPEAVAAGIKHADRVAAYFEATVLAGFSLDEAGRFFGEPTRLPKDLRQTLGTLNPQSAAVAQAAFMERFNALVGK
jgi:5'-deoxynucleotidase YfbR-like HD superfamily hydrolase